MDNVGRQRTDSMGRRTVKSSKQELKLKQKYYTPKQPGSYSGQKALQRSSKLKKSIVKEWLSHQDAYTLHKPVRYKFPRRKTIVGGIDHQWQADLIDVQSLNKENDGYKYLLTVIDILSRYAFVVPIKNKTGPVVKAAFESILSKSKRKPMKLQVDKGLEFKNLTFLNFLQEQGIEYFTTENDDIKAAIVERFNRTLKDRLWRYFTRKNSLRYVEVLQKLVWSYNHTFHSSIGRAPAQVNNSNQEEVWQLLYGQQVKTKKSKSLKVGDKVRISKTRRQFKKGYLPSWTEELFTVSKVKRTTPTTYNLTDDHGEELKGSFYNQELQKVAAKSTYRIESILEHKAGPPKLYLVKWYGYDSSFNSWIPETSLTQYIH